MPTRHTADIAKSMTFEQFAWSCARSFGALVCLKDDFSAPIPKEFKPSTYSKEQAEKCRKELALVRQMTVKECDIKALHHHAKEMRELEQSIKKSQGLKTKYDKMLEQVNAWQPPSTEHIHFKEFMIQQITDSAKNDCNTEYDEKEIAKLKADKPSGKDWKEEKIADLEQDISYYEKEHKEEVERVAGRNKWITQLRESLK